jgi:translation initiation factor eIF-2B subunit beta
MFTKFESPAQSAPRSLQSATLRAGEDGLCREGRLFLPCPAVDYIDPECIDLLITDTGGYTPSYIYRLLAEYYSREDYALSKELLERLVRR